MSKGLGMSGAHVILNGRRREKLSGAADSLKKMGVSASVCAFDVADYNASKTAITALLQSHQKIDILINNVGVRDRRNLFEFERGAIDKMLQTNLIAPFELARLVAKSMIENQWGRIINISSVAAQIPRGTDSIYAIAKGGIESMTRALAAELGANNITVNALSPGFFATKSNQKIVENSAVNSWLDSRISLKRWAEPDEISGAAVFLASDASSYITGQTIAVDGGMLSHM